MPIDNHHDDLNSPEQYSASKTSVPFLTQAAFLEEQAKSDPSVDPEMVDVIVDALDTDKDLRSYFFRIGPHVGWLRIFWERGFLSTPPEPVKTEEGFALPRWEAQECLVSAARGVPDIVVKHVKSIKGHPVYFERALVALRNISSEQLEEALPTVFGWLDDPQVGRWIALESLELLKKLATDRRYAAAFDLLRRITRPLTPSGPAIEDLTWRVGADTILPIDEYHNGIFWKALEPLQELDATRSVSILEEQLRETLRLEAEAINDADFRGRSFWRNTIENSGQDPLPEYKDVLLVALRNSINKWVEADVELAGPKIESYLTDSFEIFRRLGLYALHQYPDRFPSFVERELLSSSNIDDIGIHHEYFILLQKGYRFLPTTTQEHLLDLIMSGPTEEKRAEVAEWLGKDGVDREAYVENYCKTWIRDRLWMIREHLSGEPKNRLYELLSHLGEPEHPDYTHWMGGAFAISDVSPVTEDELSAQRPEEVVSFLKSWKPNPQALFGSERESHGALAQQAARVILSNLPAYKDHLFEISSLRPSYAASLLSVPANEVDSKTIWDLRLNICERLLADDNIRTNMDYSLDEGGWISFRRASISMIKAIVEKDDQVFPDEFLPRIRDLLLIHVHDPDPTLETDRPGEGVFGHDDPLTVAINHNRSEALYCLIRYAQKIANHDSAGKGFGCFGIDPVVLQVLSRKVKRQEDPSLAVHSVFGRELNLLFSLDREWVNAHIEDIFPTGNDSESVAFYVAAWDSFILDSRVFSEVFEFLRPKYERAIDHVTKGYITKSHLRPVEHLASHLLVEYFDAEYDIRSADGQKSLIAKFFNETGPDSRAQGAWMLSQMTAHRQKEIQRIWPRSKNLWQWRMDMASAVGHTSEFNREVGGFSHLLEQAPDEETVTSLWPLLEGLLPYIGRSKTFDRVWHNLQEYLAKRVSIEPVRSIQYYRLMHDQLEAPLMYYADEAKTILETAAEDKNSREDTLRLIDKIARSGNREFAYIFDKYTA